MVLDNSVAASVHIPVQCVSHRESLIKKPAAEFSYLVNPNTSLASERTFVFALNGPPAFHLYRSASPEGSIVTLSVSALNA